MLLVKQGRLRRLGSRVIYFFSHYSQAMLATMASSCSTYELEKKITFLNYIYQDVIYKSNYRESHNESEETQNLADMSQALIIPKYDTQRIRSRLFGAADVRDRQTEKQMSDSVIA